MKRFKLYLPWVMLAAALSVSIGLFASAGGGGGGGGGGDGDGGAIVALLELLWYILVYIPFPWNLVVIGGIIFILYLIGRNVKAGSTLNNITSINNINENKNVITPEFLGKNPGFNEVQFKQKATIAFMEIQKAWEEKNLSRVRRFISDGVYQRFNTQFRIMNALGQVNHMQDIQIRKLFLDAVENDGDYHIIHVGVHFEMEDDFLCEKFPELNQAGHLENLEYWSFIKRSGAEKNIYSSNNCPKCGANLPEDGGEVSKCAHCGTLTYLGDYDWVLSEISQGDDYINEPKKLGKNGKKTAKLREVIGRNSSVQLLEDKASNAFMQLVTAMVEKKPELMRRFVTDEVYESLKEKMRTEPHYLFNRLYLNDVTLVDYFNDEGKDNLVFAMKRSAQRVGVEGEKLWLTDNTVVAENKVLILSRDAGAQEPKGTLYSHSCPNCAAPVPDTTEIKCAYCGELLNSTKFEWIVSSLFDSDEYASWKKEEEPDLVNDIDPSLLDSLYDVRDFAINNVMIMVMADGNLAEDEIKFVRKIARRWGYKPDRLNAMYEMATAKKLVLRLPEQEKKKRKVYKLMVKAAMAEGSISPEEQAILDDVKKQLAEPV